MKTFKKADLIFQVALIVTFTILVLLKVVNIVTAYFVVGSIQVLSMLIHAVTKRNTRKGSKRYYYHRITAIIISVAALSCVTPLIFIALYSLLFFAPFMAIYYVWICFYEVSHAAKRPLELI